MSKEESKSQTADYEDIPEDAEDLEASSEKLTSLKSSSASNYRDLETRKKFSVYQAMSSSMVRA